MKANNNTFKEKPQKQGGLYSLNLGQNNGPYLPKDIMISNSKSMQLILTNRDGNEASNAQFMDSLGTKSIAETHTALEL